jgi:hypothetical protein
MERYTARKCYFVTVLLVLEKSTIYARITIKRRRRRDGFVHITRAHGSRHGIIGVREANSSGGFPIPT